MRQASACKTRAARKSSPARRRNNPFRRAACRNPAMTPDRLLRLRNIIMGRHGQAPSRRSKSPPLESVAGGGGACDAPAIDRSLLGRRLGFRRPSLQSLELRYTACPWRTAGEVRHNCTGKPYRACPCHPKSKLDNAIRLEGLLHRLHRSGVIRLLGDFLTDLGMHHFAVLVEHKDAAGQQLQLLD